MRRRIFQIWICAVAAALTGFGGEALAQGKDRLVFGVVPQQSATRLARNWVPLLDRLSRETGLEVHFATAKDIPTFEKCLSAGAYDFAYMNPYHYVVFHQDPGYVAFAKQKDKLLKGILVTRADSKIRDLKDLANAKLAFPSPAAFGASILPRAELTAEGIPFSADFVKSHDSVYRAVASGLYPAGGGVLRTFANAPDNLREKLKVIYETDSYTPHAFAAHPRVDAKVVTALSIAMTALPSDAPVLGRLDFKGVEHAKDSDWDDVRALGLTRAETKIIEGDSPCRSD